MDSLHLPSLLFRTLELHKLIQIVRIITIVFQTSHDELFFPLAPTPTTTTAVPLGLTYTAVQSGAFDNIATWGGVVPTGICYIVIPSGFTVTFTGSVLSVNVITLTIDGTFQVTSTGGVGFAFTLRSMC